MSSAIAGNSQVQSCIVSKAFVSATSAGTIACTAGTWYDWTDGTTALSITLTPASAGNKLFVRGTLSAASSSSSVGIFYRVVQDGNPIFAGDTASNRMCGLGASEGATGSNGPMRTVPFSFMVTAGTASSTTIKVQVAVESSMTVNVNRQNTDTDSSSILRAASNMMIIEFNN